MASNVPLTYFHSLEKTVFSFFNDGTSKKPSPLLNEIKLFFSITNTVKKTLPMLSMVMSKN